MIRMILRVRWVRPLACLILGAVSLPAAAELEEIIVTAQKRAQTLEDVPLSVDAISGEAIRENAYSRIEDLSVMVPNFNIGDAPGEHTVNIRGIGSATSNRAFEQSVGLYVDGIYTGRPQQFLAPFLDLERVEVVRGPQGVLFGKNSNAGAVSITSARPEQTLSVALDGHAETRYGGWGVEGVINVPLTPTLAARFAALKRVEGGYMDNSGGAPDAEDDLEAYRASLLWDATDTLQIYAKIDHAKVERDGTQFQILDFGPGSAKAFYLSKDPNAEDKFDLNKQTDGNFLGNGGEPNGVDSDTYVFQADWSLPGNTITYLYGYSEYESELGADIDFGAFPALYTEGGDDFDQSSHELRITSDLEGAWDYIAGLYYLDRDYQIPAWMFHGNFDELPPPLPPFTRLRQYDENTKTRSAFAQIGWQALERVKLSAGLRYVDETKKARTSQTGYVMGNLDVPYPIPGGIPPFPNFTFTGDRDESSVTPSFNVQWDMTDATMLYVSYNEAEKSGGFNSNSAGPDGIEYDTESARGWEVGAKSVFPAQALRLNVAVFSTKFDDYQVSSYDGVAQSVNNAATTLTRGIEVDADWGPSDALTLGLSVAYLDAEYDDFPNAPCAPIPQADCVGGNFRDASGERITYAPEFSGSGYLNYQRPIGNNLRMRMRITASFSDNYHTQIDKTAATVADSYVLWNARFAIEDPKRGWELALVGQNLTDERLFNFAGNLPFQPGAVWANTKPPRLVFLEARYHYD